MTRPENDRIRAQRRVGDDTPKDIRGAYEAMRRAALRAREVARSTGTNLVFVKDGRVVRVKPEAADAGD